MSLFSLIAVLGGLVATIGVSIWLFARYRKYSNVEVGPGVLQGDGSGETEVAIPSTRIYKDTKEKMSLLRAKLDHVVNAAYSIDEAGKPGFEGDVCRAYQEGLFQMHLALIESRNSSEDLVAYVERRSPGNTTMPEISFKVARIPSPQISITGHIESSEEQRLYSGILKTVDEIGPLIAGFYYALTDSDDDTQTASAAWQLGKIRNNLDKAVDLVVELENRLAGQKG